jgi:hypothetical protein
VTTAMPQATVAILVPVRVTADLISAGEVRNCLCCAVALAIRRSLPAEFISVFPSLLGSHRGKANVSGRPQELPPELNALALQVDNGERPEPCEALFAVVIPAWDVERFCAENRLPMPEGCWAAEQLAEAA